MGGDILQPQAPQAGSLQTAGSGSRQSTSGQPAAKQAPQAPAPRHSAADEDPSDWEVLPRQWDLADFKPLKKLYRGYASKVYLAEDCGKEHRRKPGGEIVKMPISSNKIVLKVYDLLRLSRLTKYQLQREIRLHKSVQHKNIVRLVASFTQTDFCILVQDYAVNGDLYSYLHKNRIRLTEARLVQLVMHPCLSALEYLHSRNIIHRDIKPENLLLAEGDVIKLADFGLSVNNEEENPVTRAGTLDYMAPEVLVCPLKRLPSDHKEKSELAYTTKVDSWSMGVLAYELLAGRPPFSHRDETDLLQAIKTTEMQFPSSVSPSARDWVRAALVVDVQQRASIATLLNHPWIQSHRLPDTAEAGASVSSPASASPSQTAAITPESVQKALLERRHVHNQDPTDLGRQHSISPAMTAIRIHDDGNAPSGCRSPAALHLDSNGGTPNPFISPSTSTGGPAKSPQAQVASARLRGRPSSSLAARALSSLNPARASGVIGNIFGGGRGTRDCDDDCLKQGDPGGA